MDAIDVQVFPTKVRVKFSGEADDERYGRYLDRMLSVMRDEFQGRRRAVMIDATEWPHSTAVQRKMQADWMTEHTDLLRRSTSAIGFVFSSMIMRGCLRAVLWLAPLPVPHRVFASVEEANLWADLTGSDVPEEMHDGPSV
jgi:hypothetical protein